MPKRSWHEQERARRAHTLHEAQHARLREIAGNTNAELVNSLDLSAKVKCGFTKEQMAIYATQALHEVLFHKPRVLTSDELTERLATSRQYTMDYLEYTGASRDMGVEELANVDRWLARAFRLLEMDVIQRRDPALLPKR